MRDFLCEYSMTSKQSFISSVRNAIRGLLHAFLHHRNSKIMLVCTTIVICIGIYCHLMRFEWAIIILCIAVVLGLELLNTALEEALDKLHPGRDDSIGRAKDIAAGAVLFASICAAVVGLYIFLPHIL